MDTQSTPLENERLLPSGDESGSAPGDRAFRPDVEGLRAVAVALVVLYHAGVSPLSGGYIGVDVFFVISGFVITGLLLRERNSTGKTSILNFYARRIRRILPAGTLVLLATVVATYFVLDAVSGNSTANDGRWAAVFLANFHFESVGTNYLTAGLPPSPLQNFWSLSVEEQFYLVYPTLFLLLARVRGRLSLQVRLTIGLAAVIVASYWLSIVQTASHPSAAYFSPFTRSWELALGALVAVTTPWLRKVPAHIASVLTWTGLAAVLYASFAFDAQTAFPGSLVAVPVVGTALVIAGGVVAPRWGAEALLGQRPFGWLGKHSYSLYLWHWPILIIAAEHYGVSQLGLETSFLLVLVAVGLSMATYRMVENPVRHWKVPSKPTALAGLTLIVATLLVLTACISLGSTSSVKTTIVPAANEAAVVATVAAAAHITTVPESVVASRFGATYPQAADFESACVLNVFFAFVCNLGDTSSKHLMVVYGDSRALMWIPPLEAIARANHWRMVVLGRDACPTVPVTIAEFTQFGGGLGPDLQCDAWHKWATQQINLLHPNLLVFSEGNFYGPKIEDRSHGFTATQWTQGLNNLFTSFAAPGIRKVFLGSIPVFDAFRPCLATHRHDVQACSKSVRVSVSPLNVVDRAVAAAHHITYVDTVPWFCSSSCTAIIDDYVPYDQLGVHVSYAWSIYLEKVLGQSLGFPSS